ncbi:MAG: acyl carrier protein [Eubacterium sp.]|nr:acyl carrier protein [Eubacterium sp.]
MNETEKKITEMLMDIDDSVDYANEEHLIDDRILDSFAIISLVGDLEDAFDIKINASDMVPQNFNSVRGIAKMVARLEG